MLNQRLWRTNCATQPMLGLQNRSLRTGRTGLSRQVWNLKAWQKSNDKPWCTLLKIQVAYLLATSCAVPCCDSLWKGPNKPKLYRKPKPDAWVVCNEAGQAVFGNFRPWNLQQVLVPTVTSAEGEGVHLFFGARSFLRSWASFMWWQQRMFDGHCKPIGWIRPSVWLW